MLDKGKEMTLKLTYFASISYEYHKMHKHKVYKFSHRTTNAIKLDKIGVGEKSEPKVIFLFSKSNNFQ